MNFEQIHHLIEKNFGLKLDDTVSELERRNKDLSKIRDMFNLSAVKQFSRKTIDSNREALEYIYMKYEEERHK